MNPDANARVPRFAREPNHLFLGRSSLSRRSCGANATGEDLLEIDAPTRVHVLTSSSTARTSPTRHQGRSAINERGVRRHVTGRETARGHTHPLWNARRIPVSGRSPGHAVNRFREHSQLSWPITGRFFETSLEIPLNLATFLRFFSTFCALKSKASHDRQFPPLNT